MVSKRFAHVMALALGTLLIGTAYADVVNNPGPLSFTGNVDSHVNSYGGGPNMYINSSLGLLILGSIDSNGDMFFDQSDITADIYEDSNGYRTQLQATDDATGKYCPDSGEADIVMEARIRVTKVAGTSIATTPCYITINTTGVLPLTTGASGSLTGAGFKSVFPIEPELVAEVTLNAATGSCTLMQMSTINSYYGLPSTGRVQLPAAAINPSNLTGAGC